MEQHEQTYGEYLREKRVEAGKTLADVANHLGLSAPYISDVERGGRNPFKENRNKTLALYLSADAGMLNTLAVIEALGEYMYMVTEEKFKKLYEILND